MLALAGGDWNRLWSGPNGRWSLTHQYLAGTRQLLSLPANVVITGTGRDRQPLQYLNAFVRMYGADAVKPPVRQ